MSLAVQDLIAVTINLSPTAAQSPNLSSFLILGDSNVIDTKQRIRTYTTLTGVAADFGTTAPEYLAAALFFGQTPSPSLLNIGRWAKTATAGLLLGGALTPTQQLISAWTSVTAGQFKIAVDGGSLTNVTCGTFAGATTLNGIATIIQTAVRALGGAFAAVTCTWNGSQFQFVSGTTGTSSAVAALTAGTANDISAQLLCTAATDTYTVAGIAAESAVACVTLIDATIPVYWFGLNFAAGANNADVSDSDYLAVAAYIEGTGGKHLFGLTTAEAAAIAGSDTTSIGYQLKQLSYNWTFFQYSSQNPYASCSLFGLGVTVNYAASNSTINFAWKAEPGVTPEALTENQAASLNVNNYNYYAMYSNSVSVVEFGLTASGQGIDTVWNCAWLKGAVQTNMFNILLAQPKVPQTDPGMQLLAAGATSACQQAVNNAMAAPGLWTGPSFGQQKTNQAMPKGFYIYVPPISSQSSGARAARQSVPITIGVKLAGAVNTASVLIDVNP